MAATFTQAPSAASDIVEVEALNPLEDRRSPRPRSRGGGGHDRLRQAMPMRRSPLGVRGGPLHGLRPRDRRGGHVSTSVKRALPLQPQDRCWWCDAPAYSVVFVESAREVTVEAQVCAACLERLLAPYEEASS
jgi:hypothetical protein